MRHFNLGFVETYDGADNPEAWARASNVDLADRLAASCCSWHVVVAALGRQRL